MSDVRNPAPLLPTAYDFPPVETPRLNLGVERDIGLAKLLIFGPGADDSFKRMTTRKPPAPGRSIPLPNALTAAWLAPGEWLICGARDRIIAWTASTADEEGDEVLVVDLTHARASFLLGGFDARSTLASHCPLDLCDTVFAVGDAARSLLGDAGLFITRLSDAENQPCFRIIVDQTLAAYAARLITRLLPLTGTPA